MLCIQKVNSLLQVILYGCIEFGACDDGCINCLPISKGWNYAVRMYEPRWQILDATWKFAEAETVI